jgi:hypothetical protein
MVNILKLKSFNTLKKRIYKEIDMYKISRKVLGYHKT